MIWQRITTRPSLPAPALREADAEIERLESWIDAFNDAYDPANDNTYVDAIAYADSKQPPPKSSITLPGGKTKFYDDYKRKHDLTKWDAESQCFRAELPPATLPSQVVPR